MRTRTIGAAVVAMGMLAIAACSSSNSDDQPTPAPTGTPPPPPPGPPTTTATTPPPPPPPPDGGPCTFAGYVLDLVATKTTSSSTPDTTLGATCSPSTDQKDFKSLFP